MSVFFVRDKLIYLFFCLFFLDYYLHVFNSLTLRNGNTHGATL